MDWVGGRMGWVGGRTEWVGRRTEWVGGRTEWVNSRMDWVGGRTHWVCGRMGWVRGRMDWVCARMDWVGGRTHWVEPPTQPNEPSTHPNDPPTHPDDLPIHSIGRPTHSICRPTQPVELPTLAIRRLIPTFPRPGAPETRHRRSLRRSGRHLAVPVAGARSAAARSRATPISATQRKKQAKVRRCPRPGAAPLRRKPVAMDSSTSASEGQAAHLHAEADLMTRGRPKPATRKAI